MKNEDKIIDEFRERINSQEFKPLTEQQLVADKMYHGTNDHEQLEQFSEMKQFNDVSIDNTNKHVKMINVGISILLIIIVAIAISLIFL